MVTGQSATNRWSSRLSSSTCAPFQALETLIAYGKSALICSYPELVDTSKSPSYKGNRRCFHVREETKALQS
jgi:hypothetical protein